MSLVKSSIDLVVRGTESNTRDLGVASMPHKLAVIAEWASGTTANKADTIWSDTRSLAATTEAIDLRGTLTSQLDGSTVSFVEVVAIVIYNKSTTTAYNLTIGAHASAAWETWTSQAGSTVKIGPGGVFVLTSPVDGYGVTATTADILKIDSGANTVSYDILVIGRSA